MNENRMFRILYYILDKGQATAAELAEKFEVSIRTIYRDIDVISSAGIPIYTSTGRNGGIRILEHYILNKSILSSKEQQNILVALQNMEVTKNGLASETIVKLSALFQTDVQPWIDIDFSQWGAYNDMSRKFELLKEAVISRKQICFDYANPNGKVMKRAVNPVKLIYKSAAWYIQAFCLDQEAFRIFKLNRIDNLSMSGTTFDELQPPEFHNQLPLNTIPLVLQFSEEISYRVYDEFNHRCITRQRDGFLIVAVDMPNEEWLIRYLLSFGRYISVLSPAKIRTALLDEAKLLYKNNINL